MIIFGSKAAHLKSVQSNTATCQNCNTKGSIVFSVFSKHAHVFWIPFFPIGRSGVSQCQHCKSALTVKEMPDDLKQEYQMLKSETRTPIWQFSGLVILVLAVAGIAYSSEEDKKLEMEYLTNPLVGDVYEYKTDERNYTTMRVAEVDMDSVYVNVNEYETNKMSGVYKIDKDENYSLDVYSIARSDLRGMYDEGSIYDINRE